MHSLFIHAGFGYLYGSLLKINPMSLLNQQNNRGKKKGNKKNNQPGTPTSKFIQKPKSGGFVNKQSNTGAQRGS